MKKNLLHTFLIILCGIQVLAQAPTLSWQKNIGGNADDLDLISTQNFQGDIFIAGSTFSNVSGDIPANKGLSDIYVAKLNADGSSIVWSHTFGGTGKDIPADIASTTDGGLIILCYVDSTTGDFDQAGAWLLKLNNNGSTDFKKYFGGNPSTKGKVKQTSDGGYIFHSTKNVVTHGLDFWVVKADASGNPTWSKTYGGVEDEFASDILEFNSNYYVLGDSYSHTINSQSHTSLGLDIVFFQINSIGTSQWTKFYANTGDDFAERVLLNDNNEFLILGSSSNAPGNAGGVDFWIKNVDIGGSNITSFSVGGSENDFASDMYFNQSTFQPIVVGETFSDWIVGPEPDTSNILVSEIIPFGGTQWTNILGGNGYEKPTSITGTIDGGLLVSGHSYSNNGDLTGNKGGADFWLVKLAYPCPDELNLNAASFSQSISRTAESSINTNSEFTGSLSKVKLRSSHIQMNPGFKVEPGTVFETEIGGCPD